MHHIKVKNNIALRAEKRQKFDDFDQQVVQRTVHQFAQKREYVRIIYQSKHPRVIFDAYMTPTVNINARLIYKVKIVIIDCCLRLVLLLKTCYSSIDNKIENS